MTGTNVITARELMEVIDTLYDAKESLPEGGCYSELRISSAIRSLMRLAVNDIAVEVACSP